MTRAIAILALALIAACHTTTDEPVCSSPLELPGGVSLREWASSPTVDVTPHHVTIARHVYPGLDGWTDFVRAYLELAPAWLACTGEVAACGAHPSAPTIEPLWIKDDEVRLTHHQWRAIYWYLIDTQAYARCAAGEDPIPLPERPVACGAHPEIPGGRVLLVDADTGMYLIDAATVEAWNGYLDAARDYAECMPVDLLCDPVPPQPFPYLRGELVADGMWMTRDDFVMFQEFVDELTQWSRCATGGAS